MVNALIEKYFGLSDPEIKIANFVYKLFSDWDVCHKVNNSDNPTAMNVVANAQAEKIIDAIVMLYREGWDGAIQEIIMNGLRERLGSLVDAILITENKYVLK